jgi:hypothetical protein
VTHSSAITHHTAQVKYFFEGPFLLLLFTVPGGANVAMMIGLIFGSDEKLIIDDDDVPADAGSTTK